MALALHTLALDDGKTMAEAMTDRRGTVDRGSLASYLTALFGSPVEVRQLRRLGGDGDEDPKAFGYGIPLEAVCLVDRQERRFVISRTRPVQGFGHDYPADRAWQALYAHTAYNGFPRHVQSADVGFIRASGDLVSAGDAVEFFQLVEKAEGALYWLDLDRLRSAPPRPLDEDRARALAVFLAECHADKRTEPTLYERRIRELVAHGECVMGILDSYPHPYHLLPPAECEKLEQKLVAWRWRLRGMSHRLSRVHGDFHPWNILFRDGTDFSVLDRSRGEWGEPADDVSALGINYLFFGLQRSAAAGARDVAPAFWDLFCTFLDAYLRRSGDAELADVLPPFLAFRALVIAHPRWYPALEDDTRAALVGFARAMAEPGRFDRRRALALLTAPA